jgi:predicted TIM-barrel enzyme
MGLTTKGSIGAKTAMTLPDAAKQVQALADAARAVQPDILVLCHGGPISEPEDVRYILDHTNGIVGFFGASSIERLPTEVAITGCVKQFKGLGLG